MNDFARTTALLSLALLAGACTDEETDPGADEFRTTSWSCIGCNVNNSPRINDYEFPELNLDHQPNEAGVVLQGILSPSNVAYKLEVYDDDFVAMDNSNHVVATRESLVGWRIWLTLPGGVHRYVNINAYQREIPSWATNGAPISGYALAYQDPQTTQSLNVCPDSGQNTTDVSVTLILGEIYDQDLKTVIPNQTRWVTIACRDEATYKMKRMNYGPNDNFNATGSPATVAQRQATLKMITADYCGTGTSYTAQGTAVYWKNASSTVNNQPLFINPNNPPTIEAYWNENGALCLTDPRYVAPGDVQDCSLPVCPANFVGSYEWRTKTP